MPLCRLLIAFVFITFCGWACFLEAAAAAGEPTTSTNFLIPSGTKMLVVLEEDIDTDQLSLGSSINAILADDLTVDGITCIPKNTKLRALVYGVEHAKNEHYCLFDFDRVVFADGRNYSISAEPWLRSGALAIIREGKRVFLRGDEVAVQHGKRIVAKVGGSETVLLRKGDEIKVELRNDIVSDPRKALREEQITDAFINYEPGMAPKVDKNISELNRFPGWCKALNDQEPCNGEARLMLQLRDDGTAILNPENQGEASKHRVELKGLSLNRACTLWGGTRHNGENWITFDVISQKKLPELEIYHIDMKFVDAILDSYRVRGVGIGKPQWNHV